MSDSTDANLQLKKRARRRLVGAVAFAGLAAVVLPMIMDDEPKQQIQDVQIRIPGQDQAPPIPKFSKQTTPVVREKTETAPVQHAEVSIAKVAEKKDEKNSRKVVEKTTENLAEKANKQKVTEAQRAAAILEGKFSSSTAQASSTNAANGQYVILIGAFSNPSNVKILQAKIGELGVKVYTEPLDSPGGKKTRVRAGPFSSREAAETALGKMKRIGVNGIVTAKK